jgi:hypothetical protein
LSVQTTVDTIATKTDSVPRDSEQLFVRAVHRVRSIVPVTTTMEAIVLVRDKMAVISLVREATSLAKAAISLVKAVIRVKAATNLAKVVINPVKDRVVTNLVRDKKVVISPVKVRVTSVRVVMENLSRSLMASPTILIRKGLVSMAPITIRMLNTA